VGSKYELQSDSFSFNRYIHKRNYLASNDEGYVDLGDKVRKARNRFIFTLFFSFLIFILIIIFYGDSIRGS